MSPQPEPASPFRAGAIVIAILANPREKFWGAILQLSSVGLSMRGVELSSFETFIAQIRDGEPFAAGAMFFPMHRIERLELDLPEGSLPSLAQRFAQKTGQDPAPMLVSEFLPAATANTEELRAAAARGQEEESNAAGDSATGRGELR
jgi:hypothetical protein